MESTDVYCGRFGDNMPHEEESERISLQKLDERDDHVTLISTPFWSRSPYIPRTSALSVRKASSFGHYLRQSASYRGMICVSKN